MSRSARRLATYADLSPLEESGLAVEIVGDEIVEKAAPSGEHGDAQGGVLASVRGSGGRTSHPGRQTGTGGGAGARNRAFARSAAVRGRRPARK